MTKKGSIERLISNHNRRLQLLKEQQALEGMTKVDPDVTLEIENIENEIALLQTELKQLAWQATQPTQAEQSYWVLNFSHTALTPEEVANIKQLTNWPQLTVIEANVPIETEDEHFVNNVLRHIDRIKLSPYQWKNDPIVVVPAGYPPVWSILMAELYGRIGYFPDLVHRRSISGSKGKFEVWQIIDLHQIRNEARGKQ